MREQGSSDDVIRPLIGGAPPPDRLVAWVNAGANHEATISQLVRSGGGAAPRSEAPLPLRLPRLFFTRLVFSPIVRIGSRRYVIVKDAGIFGESVSLACKVARNDAMERNDLEDELKYCGISYMKVY